MDMVTEITESRYGVSTVTNPEDLNEQMFQQCVELSKHAIKRKGMIREDTLVIDSSNHFWVEGSSTQSSSDKHEDFKPTECFDGHDNTNDYALESPHYHINVSYEAES